MRRVPVVRVTHAHMLYGLRAAEAVGPYRGHGYGVLVSHEHYGNLPAILELEL